MIPVATEEIKISGNLAGKKILMQLDPNSTKHLIGILTDLYSDAERAVIREYSTNAADSHNEAGQTRPIEVTTPSALDANFRVQDWGIGMGLDDIEHTFSQYGPSTKRESNDQTGMLGLGSKSALTMVPQFFVNSVKNGLKIQAVVYRGDDEQSIMEIVDTRATDDHNGVEIVIPMKSSAGFITKINEFFQHWKPGTVLVDGKPPKLPNGLKIVDDSLWIVPQAELYHAQSDVIVMGNVAYPVESNRLHFSTYRKNATFVFFVEMGAIMFTPSREQLHYTERTLTTVRELGKMLPVQIRTKIQEDVELASTAAEAVKSLLEWDSLIGFDKAGFVWQGQKIEWTWAVKHKLYSLDRSRNQISRTSYAELTALLKPDKLVITGFNGADTSTSITKRQRDKMREYINQTNNRIRQVHIFDQFPGSPWTDDIATVDWSVVNAVTMPKRTYTRGTSNGGYETLHAGYQKKVTQFTKKHIAWASRTEYLSVAEMERLFPDTEFVILPANRVNRFERLYPKAKHIRKLAVEQYMRQVKLLTKDQLLRRGMSAQEISFFRVFDGQQVDDLEFARMVQLSGVQDVSGIDRLRNMMYPDTKALAMVHRLDPPRFDWKTRYPLLNERWYGVSYLDDVVLYINAKFAQLKKEGKL